MYGVIILWQVKPEHLAAHAEVMRRALQIERERCPELLLNLPFGPAADGTFGAAQAFADEATYRAFPGRVEREEAELWQLWARTGAYCEPLGSRTYHFSQMDFLDAAGLGGMPGARSQEG